jgi:hypothetical protein
MEAAVSDPAALIAEAVGRLKRFGQRWHPDFMAAVRAELLDAFNHGKTAAPAQVDVDGLCAYLSAHGADEHLCKVARAYFDQARTVTPAAPDADWEERLWLYEVKLQYGPR